MIVRLLMVFCLATFATLQFGNSIACADNQGRLGGRCGFEAAKYVLNRFSIPVVRGELSELEILERATLAALRLAFERFSLKVVSYEGSAAGTKEWSKLNQLVQTRNAIVLVLGNGSSISDEKHYFALNNVSDEAIEVIDPATQRVVLTKMKGNPDTPIFAMVIYHPDATFLTMPFSGNWFWLGLLVIFFMEIGRHQLKRFAYWKSSSVSRLTLLGAFSVIVASGCGRATQVELVGERQDLGNVNVGEDVVAQFEVLNQGIRSVRLSAIELGCSCLRTDFIPTVVEPQRVYKFSVSTKGDLLGIASQSGRILYLDDQNNIQEASFQFRYNVQAELAFFPNPYYIGIVEEADIAIGVPLELSIVDANDEVMSATVLDVKVGSHRGLDFPECTSVAGNKDIDKSARLTFSARKCDGSFEAELVASVKLADGKIMASSAESVGRFWLGKLTKLVI